MPSSTHTIRHTSVEVGLRVLRLTLRHSRTTSAYRPSGRVRFTALGPTAPDALAMQSTYLRLVSIAEATLDLLGSELTDRAINPATAAVRLLALEKELAASATWEQRRRLYKRHHGLSLTSCDNYKYVEGAIEVRNAIAHGLGRLTTRQQLSGETARLLAQANIQAVNGNLYIERVNLTECAAGCDHFLRSVDRRV